MSVEKSNIAKLIKLENNGELKRILGSCKLNPEAFTILEDHINLKAQSLISSTVEEAKKRYDKTIVTSHTNKAIDDLELKNKMNTTIPFLEITKIFGTIGITVCLTHIVQASQNLNSEINFLIVILGVLGGLLLGIGLFYKK